MRPLLLGPIWGAVVALEAYYCFQGLKVSCRGDPKTGRGLWFGHQFELNPSYPLPIPGLSPVKRPSSRSNPPCTEDGGP